MRGSRVFSNPVTNDLPGLTTLQACCNNPTRDKISLLVAFFRVNQVDSWLRVRSSLSEGSCASMHCVSEVIPRNVMRCDGPSNFSIARGILRS